MQSVLADGEEGASSKVGILNYSQFPGSKKLPNPVSEKEGQKGSDGLKRANSQVLSETEDAQLRAQWAEEFLEHGGFAHMLKEFMACSVPKS